jgi:hypothetical protein
MKVFETNIPIDVASLLSDSLKECKHFETANQFLFDFSGIKNFFESQFEFDLSMEALAIEQNIVADIDRVEYGDFQTNIDLAIKITRLLLHQKNNPKVMVEPTCGKGNFIIASIKVFKGLENIYANEINKPYIWEAKFNILHHYISNPSGSKPTINITHQNVFDIDFKEISAKHKSEEILVIGNPPWVTNSKLGSLNSYNLPIKSNFKNHNGLDAMTGKGNFDIGEFISLMMFDAFQTSKGAFAFLVKNAVIKNVIYDQKDRNYKISSLKRYGIDSKKEFNVSVEASLLMCQLNQSPAYQCEEFILSDNSIKTGEFGWMGDKFVSNIEHYEISRDIDGTCPFEWRQGVKHDISAIMEFEKSMGSYVNNQIEKFDLEDDLVYGLLKSSDLKKMVINSTRKYTIITQKKVGEDTSGISRLYPMTYSYLSKNKGLFDSRKSSIYKNKPDFSIFGIGDYSFKPFKVAISGMYKNYCFNLILPQDEKPIMLDDTCYFIGFDDLEYAVYTLIMLNSHKTKALLESITFPDAKRTFTKDVLMRIDLTKIALGLSMTELEKKLQYLYETFGLAISIDRWDSYLKLIHPTKTIQSKMFV